ncbi:MAG: hypothetical protein E7I11_23030 [Klebsiella michiganensis]|nr:hypothetical protein [Klebsiella michiganensis]
MQFSNPFDNPQGQFYILRAWLAANWSTLTPAHHAS